MLERTLQTRDDRATVLVRRCLIVALLSTKVPILLGHGFLIFNLPHINRYGFWSMQREARVNRCMLLACLFLLMVGSGGWSIDARLRRPGPP